MRNDLYDGWGGFSPNATKEMLEASFAEENSFAVKLLVFFNAVGIVGVLIDGRPHYAFGTSVLTVAAGAWFLWGQRRQRTKFFKWQFEHDRAAKLPQDPTAEWPRIKGWQKPDEGHGPEV